MHRTRVPLGVQHAGAHTYMQASCIRLPTGTPPRPQRGISLWKKPTGSQGRPCAGTHPQGKVVRTQVRESFPWMPHVPLPFMPLCEGGPGACLKGQRDTASTPASAQGSPTTRKPGLGMAGPSGDTDAFAEEAALNWRGRWRGEHCCSPQPRPFLPATSSHQDTLPLDDGVAWI